MDGERTETGAGRCRQTHGDCILHGSDFRPWNFKLEMSGCGQWGRRCHVHVATHTRYVCGVDRLHCYAHVHVHVCSHTV